MAELDLGSRGRVNVLMGLPGRAGDLSPGLRAELSAVLAGGPRSLSDSLAGTEPECRGGGGDLNARGVIVSGSVSDEPGESASSAEPR